MSSIAILGSGRVGTALAAGFTAAGHRVRVGSRHPDKVSADWNGPKVEISGVRDAVGDAEVVVNATPGDTTLERLGALAAELEDRILVDVSNAVSRAADGGPGALVYPNSSLAEHLQDALPRTRVVKTLNTMLFTVMTAPGSLATTPTAFLSGDDAQAKAVVRDLLGDLGWAPEQLVDLGPVSTARGPEALMLLVPDVIRACGFAPFAIGVIR